MPSNSNNLNVGMRCIKYMLFVINFMFVLTSVLLITVGMTIRTIYSEFDHFLDDHFLSPPSLMVAVGIILLIVSLFGCVGAIKESTMLINIYGVLLSMIFILEIAAAISAFALQGQVQKMLHRTMNSAIERYHDYEYVQEAVDQLQWRLQCCGVNGYEDWLTVGSTTVDYNANTTQNLIPFSCCEDPLYSPSAEYDNTDNQCFSGWFEAGCFHRLSFVIAQSAMLIATGATTVAFVQILGVICAFMLAKTIRRTKSLREARRWQLQQSLGINVKPYPNHPPYVQLDKYDKEKCHDVTYLPNSPSLIASLLIAIGVAIQTIYTDFVHFLDDHFLSPPALMVAVGIILMIVALFGCVGAVKESTMLINIYGVLLAVVFILEVSAAIAAFALSGQIASMLIRTMNDAIQRYEDGGSIKDAVDYMHYRLDCCGTKGPNDWKGILASENKTTEGIEDIVLPDSCCSTHNYSSDGPVYCSDWRLNGCFHRMYKIIRQCALFLASGAILIGLTQLLGVIWAFMIAKYIRRHKSLKAARQWQLQQSLGITNTTKPPFDPYSPPYMQLQSADLKQGVTYTPNSPSVN